MTLKFKATLLFLITSALLGFAQEESEPPAIAADRPGAGNGTALVEVGFIQLETGWDRFEVNDPLVDITGDAFANTLLRTGLSKQFEMRFGWSGYQRIDTDSVSGSNEISGIGDLFAGVRMQVRDGKNGGPVIAVDATTTIPAGDDEVSSDSYDPTLNLSLDQALGERLGLNVNAGVTWSEVDDGSESSRLSDGFYSISLGFSFGGGFGGYVEYFGNEPLSNSGSGTQSFDGGFTYTPANNWQLDIFYGQNAEDSNATFVGAGVAVRFPN